MFVQSLHHELNLFSIQLLSDQNIISFKKFKILHNEYCS